MSARKIPISQGIHMDPKDPIRKPSGFIMVILLFLSLFFILIGLLGYKYYDRVISKHMSFFFCLIPAMTMSLILLAAAFFFNKLRIRKVIPSTPNFSTSQSSWMPPELVEKKRKMAVERMREKREENIKFLKEIEEQRKDGLITENIYADLYKDHTLQLRVIDGALMQLEKLPAQPGGKTKGWKKE